MELSSRHPQGQLAQQCTCGWKPGLPPQDGFSLFQAVLLGNGGEGSSPLRVCPSGVADTADTACALQAHSYQPSPYCFLVKYEQAAQDHQTLTERL